MIKYSIIIPTRNRCNLLERCLTKISELEKPEYDYEVLVIDNGSTDNTGQTCLSFEGKINNLNYFYEEEPGLHIGRHSGARNSRGEVLCYIDDDSFADKYWLLGIEKAFKKPETILATGPILPEFEVDPPKWLKYSWNVNKNEKSLGTLTLLDFGGQEKKISPLYVWGANFIIRKKIFYQFGGTHPDCMPEESPEYIGDGETGLAKKLIEKNKQALYSPEIKIYHYVPQNRMTEGYFLTVYFMQGISDSFTDYRIEYGLYKKQKKQNKYLKLSNYFNFLKKIMLLILDNDYKKYKKILTKAKKSYNEGKLFHKQKVKTNPGLLEYVLKENYL